MFAPESKRIHTEPGISMQQVLAMAFLVVVFALLGFLSPANRGGLSTALLLLFVFMGSFSGYVSARLYKVCETR